MLTCVANQVHAIGQNFVTVWRAGFRPNLLLAIERKAGDCLTPRNVAPAFYIKNNALAVAGNRQ